MTSRARSPSSPPGATSAITPSAIATSMLPPRMIVSKLTQRPAIVARRARGGQRLDRLRPTCASGPTCSCAGCTSSPASPGSAPPSTSSCSTTTSRRPRAPRMRRPGWAASCGRSTAEASTTCRSTGCPAHPARAAAVVQVGGLHDLAVGLRAALHRLLLERPRVPDRPQRRRSHGARGDRDHGRAAGRGLARVRRPLPPARAPAEAARARAVRLHRALGLRRGPAVRAAGDVHRASAR